MKGKKLMLEEEEEEPEAELEAEQEAKLDLEAQLESEPQELSPRSEDKKKVGQEGGLSALVFDQSVLQAKTTCVKRLEPGRVENQGAKCSLPPMTRGMRIHTQHHHIDVIYRHMAVAFQLLCAVRSLMKFYMEAQYTK